MRLDRNVLRARYGPVALVTGAAQALAKLGRGPVWVVGWRNRLVHALLTRVLSRRQANRLIAGNLRGLYRR